jgi:rhamnogalacturonyl hydrolase YesR
MKIVTQMLLTLSVMLTAAHGATTTDESPCFARFVPERLDDFAWENDRIAFRVYGPKLWSMPPKRCGSGIDVWVKKVRYPIINKWMKPARRNGGNYHKDEGEGADFYKVGKTLGCGGMGYMVDGKLEINRHYENYKVIQGEGDRIEFELTYAPLEVGGKTVAETKRISMEAGSNLFTVSTTFKVTGGDSVTAAVGIVLRDGEDELRHGKNWISYAEPMSATDGQTYCGVVFENEAELKKADGHALMLVSVKDGETLTYRAGAAWSKGLDFTNMNEWTAYLEKAAGVETVTQKTDHFSDWPEGKSPTEIGHAVSENFLKRKHYETMVKKHNQKARHQTWRNVVYPEVCVWFGALKVARESGDDALAQQLVDRLNRYEKDPKMFPFKFHVDHSVNGVIPLEVYRLTNEDRYLKMGMKRAEDQWSKTTPDGITRQARYWVDDIYMIAAIQSAAFRVTGDQKYLDRAALTIATYLKKLQKEDGLFWHAEDSPFVWGRGAGWYAAGMTEILKVLPPENPHYAPILAGYKKMMAALLLHQSESGLWRQLVDKPDAWVETSGTGMFTYAMVTGVKRGWLDEETYGPVARKAWLALVDQLDEEGNMQNVCVGTNKAFKEAGSNLDAQYEFYLARPRYTGDYHGQAPVLWTAAALLEDSQE